MFEGEVANGGLSQFFSNSSGNLFYETREALARISAVEALALLDEAKVCIFGPSPVPKDQYERTTLLIARDCEAELENYNRRYDALKECPADLLEAFVAETRLIDTAPQAGPAGAQDA